MQASGAARRPERIGPDVKIVAISADDSQGSQYDMMRAGAVGYLLKAVSTPRLRWTRPSTCRSTTTSTAS